jgi:hypothetical protein
MLSWPAKDPDEVLEFDIAWTVRLYSKTELDRYNAGETVVPSDTIVTSVFTLPTGIVSPQASNSTTATKVWLTGGTEGQTYLILNRITTAGGRTMDQTVKLKIKTK